MAAASDDHLRIFVSAVSTEFGSYRDFLRSKLARHDTTVHIQEDFIAGGIPTLDKLDEYLRRSEVVVHLVGDRTGALANSFDIEGVVERYPDLGVRLPPLHDLLRSGEALSYTQWEAWLAVYHRKVLLLAVPDPGAPRDDGGHATAEQRDSQQRHVERLRRVGRHVEVRFSDAKDLVNEVQNSTLRDVLNGARARDAVERYTVALLSSFRLDGAGLAIDGASAHALRLADAYDGMRYEIRDERVGAAGLLTPERDRVVVVGGPGCGKTVTLKQVLTTAARNGGLPVYLRLAEVANEARREFGAADVVQAAADRATRLGVPELNADVVTRQLAAGSATIALDGFDEVGDRSARERVVAAIGELVARWPAARVIVASRPIEYDATPLAEDGGFVAASPLPLDTAQARTFLRRCVGDDGRTWASIMRDAHLRELATRPLFLTLLGLLARRGPLPAGSAAVNEAVVTMTLESWEAAKRGADLPRARETLEDLALHMERRDAPAQPLLEAHAHQLAGSVSGVELVRWMVARTGLLVREEEFGAVSVRSTVRFAHLHLQEHLAGCALARRAARRDVDAPALARELAARGSHEALRYAAAALAQAQEGDVLIDMVRSRLADEADALLAAALLAQADAAFVAAPEVTSALVAALRPRGAGADTDPRVRAVCALVPRPAALDTVREIALRTRSGRRWLGGSSTGVDREHEPALAQAMRTLVTWGTDDDRARVVDWVLEHAASLTVLGEWVALAPDIERVRGVAAASSFVRLQVLERARFFDDVVSALDAIEVGGRPERAVGLALEAAHGDVGNAAAFGAVTWLESRGDAVALAAADDYYRRLRAVLEVFDAEDHDVEQVVGWGGAQLWPARDSNAVHELRSEALRHRRLAYHVLDRALADPRYAEAGRRAWLWIATEEPENSRRSGILATMLHEARTEVAAPLLLEALASWRVVLWHGERIVEHLVAAGQRADVRSRLEQVLDSGELADDVAPRARALLASVR